MCVISVSSFHQEWIWAGVFPAWHLDCLHRVRMEGARLFACRPTWLGEVRMCWVCAADRSEIARNYWGAQFAPASIHFQTATLAEAADGVLEFTRWDDAYALASTELVGSDKLTDA